MNRKKLCLVLMFMILAAQAAACDVSFSSARISNAILSKGVSDKMEALDPTTVFDSADPVVHCVVQLANVPDGTKVRARWVVVKVEGVKEGENIGETDIEAGSSKNIIDFTYKPPASGFLPGEYKIDLYLNPKQGAQEPPAKSLPFTVKSSGPQITSAVLSTTPNGSSPVTSFSNDAEALYCYIEYRGTTPGTKLSAQWTLVESQGQPVNRDIDRASVTIDDPRQNTATFSLTPSGVGLPPGQYKVDLFINDSATPIKTLPFTISG